MNSLLGNYCHVSNQVNAYTDEPNDAPLDGVFDDCSPLKDIYEALMFKREVTFQASWHFEPTTYTAFDILLDRINENADTTDLAASIFAAALFNENKGEAATDLAQASDFEAWVFDFFKYLQNSKPAPFTKPNLEFLNLRGDV
jgi:hypothetical protein